MYGLIVKVKLVRGTRDQFIELLQESAAGMPGCLSYVVAKDTSDDDVVWVTEVWNRQHDHERSLSLPRVQAVIPRAKAIVANFERIAATTPVWAAVGLERSPSP
jgi:quinol monooxygenase YgiN